MDYIRCNLDGTVVVHGVPSRKIYHFTPENNHVLPISTEDLPEVILEADVPDLLQKRRAYRACCQSPNMNLVIFERFSE